MFGTAKTSGTFVKVHPHRKPSRNSDVDRLFGLVFVMFRILGVDVRPKRGWWLLGELYFAAIILVDVVQLVCILNTFTVLNYTLIAGVTAFIQLVLLIQAAMLRRRRRALVRLASRARDTLRHLRLQGRAPPRWKIAAAIAAILVVRLLLLSVGGIIDTAAVRAGLIPPEYYFNLLPIATPPWVDVVNLVWAVARHLSYAWMDCFVLYYCLLCWALREAWRRCEGLDDYWRVGRDVAAADHALCAHVFCCCSLMLIVLFMQVNIFKYFPAKFRLYLLLLGGWNLLVFVSLSEGAARVAGAAEKAHAAALVHLPYRHLLRLGHLPHLTIWNIVGLRRITIVNIMGAFVTYAVILLSL